jgi:hypothetical protein
MRGALESLPWIHYYNGTIGCKTKDERAPLGVCITYRGLVWIEIQSLVMMVALLQWWTSNLYILVDVISRRHY